MARLMTSTPSRYQRITGLAGWDHHPIFGGPKTMLAVATPRFRAVFFRWHVACWHRHACRWKCEKLFIEKICGLLIFPCPWSRVYSSCQLTAEKMWWVETNFCWKVLRLMDGSPHRGCWDSSPPKKGINLTVEYNHYFSSHSHTYEGKSSWSLDTLWYPGLVIGWLDVWNKLKASKLRIGNQRLTMVWQNGPSSSMV